MDVFSWDKRFWEDMVAVFKYPKVILQKMGQNCWKLFQTRQEATGLNIKEVDFIFIISLY